MIILSIIPINQTCLTIHSLVIKFAVITNLPSVNSAIVCAWYCYTASCCLDVQAQIVKYKLFCFVHMQMLS